MTVKEKIIQLQKEIEFLKQLPEEIDHEYFHTSKELLRYFGKDIEKIKEFLLKNEGFGDNDTILKICNKTLERRLTNE